MPDASLHNIEMRAKLTIHELEKLRADRRRHLTSTQSVSLLRDINEDIQRIAGKIEGINLVLSYLEDERRMKKQR